MLRESPSISVQNKIRQRSVATVVEKIILKIMFACNIAIDVTFEIFY